MIYPDFIKPGDYIGVTALSSGNGDKLHIRRLESAIRNLKEKGYNICETPDVRKDKDGRSAPKEERAKEYIDLVKEKNVKAIIVARGGEYLSEALPLIDFNEVKNNPKWIEGYSDTTWMTFYITTTYDIATIHGYNFGTFGQVPWHESIYNHLKLLEGNCLVQESYDKYQDTWQEEILGTEPFVLNSNTKWINARGEDEIILNGRIIGGCIDTLDLLFNTKYNNVTCFCEKYKQDGIIWYFDNCELSSKEVKDALVKFKESGWFKYCRGIIFGRPMTRTDGLTFEEAVMESTGDLELPVIFDTDIGHVQPQIAVINGSLAKVESKNGKGKISFILK